MPLSSNIIFLVRPPYFASVYVMLLQYTQKAIVSSNLRWFKIQEGQTTRNMHTHTHIRRRTYMTWWSWRESTSRWPNFVESENFAFTRDYTVYENNKYILSRAFMFHNTVLGWCRCASLESGNRGVIYCAEYVLLLHAQVYTCRNSCVERRYRGTRRKSIRRIIGVRKSVPYVRWRFELKLLEIQK